MLQNKGAIVPYCEIVVRLQSVSVDSLHRYQWPTVISRLDLKSGKKYPSIEGFREKQRLLDGVLVSAADLSASLAFVDMFRCVLIRRHKTFPTVVFQLERAVQSPHQHGQVQTVFSSFFSKTVFEYGSIVTFVPLGEEDPKYRLTLYGTSFPKGVPLALNTVHFTNQIVSVTKNNLNGTPE